MLLVLENKEEILAWLKKEYKINLEEDFDDVQTLKNATFTGLYSDAKKYLARSTVGCYRRAITGCGNNKRRLIKSAVLALGRAVYKKKQFELKELNNLKKI